MQCIVLIGLLTLEQGAPNAPAARPPWLAKHGAPLVHYYERPDANLAIQWMDDMLSEENLEHPWFKTTRGPHVLGLLASQLGDIALGHPEVVRHYESQFDKTNNRGKLFLIDALKVCGDQNTQRQVTQWLANPPGKDGGSKDVEVGLRSLAKVLGEQLRPRRRDQPVKDPADIDFRWSNFYITGEFAAVAPIMDIFDQETPNPALVRLARWSTQSNLRQHAKLRKLFEQNAEKRPQASREVMGELLKESQPKPFPNGEFTGSRQPDWSLKFGSNGAYTVLRNGQTMVEGKYVVKRDEITLTDIKGPLASPEGEKTGKFRWRIVGNSLQFKTILDNSGRAAVLTSNTWKPAKK